MDLAHALRVVRALAFLPPIAATTATGCTPWAPGCDGFDQRQGATVTGGASASASGAAQCATPGPFGASCTEPVICGPGISCCGRWSCGPSSSPDAGGALVWTAQICEGPLDPPESAG